MFAVDYVTTISIENGNSIMNCYSVSGIVNTICTNFYLNFFFLFLISDLQRRFIPDTWSECSVGQKKNMPYFPAYFLIA